MIKLKLRVTRQYFFRWSVGPMVGQSVVHNNDTKCKSKDHDWCDNLSYE